MYARLTISILFCLFLTPVQAQATSYYADLGTAAASSTCGNGLATTTAFCSIDQFTEAARSAGDILFVRRNTATTTGLTDLNFTSDGTIVNPIKISADNDNLWNEASTTIQTYTVAAATTTFYASASITNVQVGDWFYVSGDCTQTYNASTLNQCDFFYEVAAVTGTALSLHIPYKGNQTGSGLSLINLGKNPQWGQNAAVFNWNFGSDDYWYIKGIHIRSTEAPNVGITTSSGLIFFDSIFQSDGVTSTGIDQVADRSTYIIRKSRFFNYNSTMLNVTVDAGGPVYIYDTLFDANGSGGEVGPDGTATTQHAEFWIYDSYIRNSNPDLGTISEKSFYFLRNVALLSSTEIGTNTTLMRTAYFEDYDGVLGQNRTNSSQFGTNINTPVVQSTTSATFLRSGGGPTSIRVIPGTNTSARWEYNKIKLFEYPIYTDTSSKQYDVYFMSTSTAGWIQDPLGDVASSSSELYIECEYWAHNTGATSTRKIKKSTATVDFNGSTAWQALSVTCQPTQEGVLYLRGWYGKLKETRMNEFYVDGTPVIN